MSLTPKEREILEMLNRGDELEEFEPGGWWIHRIRVSPRVCWNLLRKMALHEEQSAGLGHKIYKINETGQKLLKENKDED